MYTKPLYIFIISSLFVASCMNKEKKSLPPITFGAPPVTKTVDVSEDYFGTKISDPYRWLEYDSAADVAEWVKEQNKYTFGYLNQIPFRNNIKQRLEEIWNYAKYSSPFKKGSNYFFYKNDGLQNQSVLYIQKGLKDEAKVLLDPNKLSTDGTVSLGGISFSHDNKYMAYSLGKAGSDWQEIFVMEVETGKILTDKIEWVKFGGASWKGNGFYYSRYDKPSKSTQYSAANKYQKVYYHELGQTQDKDRLIYEDPKYPLRYYWPTITEDEDFLFINIAEGTSGGEIWFSDLKKGNDTDFKLLVQGFESNPGVVETHNGKILLMTDKDAPKYKLVAIDPTNTAPENWVTLIPENKHLLEWVSLTGNKLFAGYQQDVSSRIYQYAIDGKMEKAIDLPGIGSAGGFGGSKNDMETFYSFTSFTVPSLIYRYDIGSGKSELFKTIEFPADLSNYTTKQVFYKSKDGTQIPMFVTHKKDLKMDGNNPTLLYGYGGFNISITPSFSTSKIAFLEQGGIFAVANLRGGGEYGEDWHKAGMLEKKQTVFDDFIAAAEFLVAEKYTSKDRLAIQGRSNGGLLVGACMTQRPDLFKVALPGVGVLDMLRYHKSTVGWGWAVEYGKSDVKNEFEYLLKYSPLHTIKDNVQYPATMVTTGDHDDRVVPSHSFKFIATLQAKAAAKNKNIPYMVRIDTNAGHGAGKPTSKTIEEEADVWAFTMYNLGMVWEKP
jgi:prolyl oligopeptidase